MGNERNHKVLLKKTQVTGRTQGRVNSAKSRKLNSGASLNSCPKVSKMKVAVQAGINAKSTEKMFRRERKALADIIVLFFSNFGKRGASQFKDIMQTV